MRCSTCHLACRRFLHRSLPPAGNAQQTKVLRYAFPIAETGFDPVQVTDLYSRFGHTAHLRRAVPLRPSGASVQDQTQYCRRDAGSLGRFSCVDDQAASRHLLPGRPGVQGATARTDGARLCLFVQALLRSALEVAELPSAIESKESVGMAALRDEALKSKKPFDYDRDSRRAFARSTSYTLAVQVGGTAAALSAYCSHWATCSARSRVKWSRPTAIDIHEQAGGNRPVSSGRVAALVEDRAGEKSYLSGALYDAEPNADDAEGQASAALASAVGGCR